MGRARHHREARTELCTLRQHEIHLGGSTERKHLEAIGMAGHHIQRAGANGAGGTEDGDLLFLHGVVRLVSIMARGSVGSRASTRSPDTLMATMNSAASTSIHQPCSAIRL